MGKMKFHHFWEKYFGHPWKNLLCSLWRNNPADPRDDELQCYNNMKGRQGISGAPNPIKY